MFPVRRTIFDQRADAAVLPIKQARIRHAIQRGGNVVFTQFRQGEADFAAGIKLSLNIALPGRLLARCRHGGQRADPQQQPTPSPLHYRLFPNEIC